MKIKNLKYTIGLLGLTLTLSSFTGCSKEISNEVIITKETLENEELELENKELITQIEILKQENKEYKEENKLLKETNDKYEEINSTVLEKLAADINNELVNTHHFSYNIEPSILNENEKLIGINIYRENNKKCDLTDEFYSNLNLFLSQPNTNYYLSLGGLENEIDFSKIDLSNIKHLKFYYCKENFNYKSFTNNKYKSLYFYDVPLKDMKNFITNSTNNESEIISFSSTNQNIELVKFIVDNDINLKGLTVDSHDSDEICYLLEKVKAEVIGTFLYDTDIESKKDLNLNLNLNEKTTNFYLFIPNGKNCSNLRIESNNKKDNLYFGIDYIRITEDAIFSFPDNSFVLIEGYHNNSNPFYDLSNVSFGYKEVINNTYIEYDKKNDNIEEVISELKKEEVKTIRMN